MDEIERWKDIPGFPGYQASDRGRIQSKLKANEWRILKLQTQRKTNKYSVQYIGLWANHKHHRKFVHRLVLEAFAGQCPDGHVCCHGNGDALDNRLENLRWDTPSANKADSVKHGSYKGENSGNAIVTEMQVREIRQLREEGVLLKIIARRYKMSISGIQNILRGSNWRHVP